MIRGNLPKLATIREKIFHLGHLINRMIRRNLPKKATPRLKKNHLSRLKNRMIRGNLPNIVKLIKIFSSSRWSHKKNKKKRLMNLALNSKFLHNIAHVLMKTLLTIFTNFWRLRRWVAHKINSHSNILSKPQKESWFL